MLTTMETGKIVLIRSSSGLRATQPENLSLDSGDLMPSDPLQREDLGTGRTRYLNKCFVFQALDFCKCMILGHLASLQNEPNVQRFAAEFGNFRLH